jgi:hypothetical protein
MARLANSLPGFLLAFRKSIVDAGVASASCCQICTEERTLEFAQGQYIVMVIPGLLNATDQGGAGENETIFDGTLTLRMLAQTALDVATSDVVALTDDDTTTGIYVLFQQLLSVVRFWDECDDYGNAYLTQPARVKGGITQPRRHEKHAQYVFADFTVEYRICIGMGASGA